MDLDHHVTNGYMRPDELKKIRCADLQLTQQQLAAKLGTTRMTITRYENGTRRIPAVLAVALQQLCQSARIPMAGIVAAGKPIEPVPQSEFVEVPSEMAEGGERFALRVTGESMRDDGILPGDLVIVRKQATSPNGQTVIALLNGQATIKKYYRRADSIELRPANPAMEPIEVTSKDDFKIQGVVVGLIRCFR